MTENASSQVSSRDHLRRQNRSYTNLNSFKTTLPPFKCLHADTSYDLENNENHSTHLIQSIGALKLAGFMVHWSLLNIALGYFALCG